jgi:hypothetical protein
MGATGPGVTTTGEALIGGVSDDPYLFRTFVRVVQNPNTPAHIGTELRYVDDAPACHNHLPPFEVEAGQPSRGVNAAGLAFTCALVIEHVPQNNVVSSTTFAALSHRMMNECSFVEEVIVLFQAAGAITPAFSVLLADAAGDLAHIEVGTHGISVLHRYSRKQPGIVIAVNCYQSPHLIPFNKPEAQLINDRNNNGFRLRRGWELAKQHRGAIDVDVIGKYFLSDHQNKHLDCANNPLIKWWGYSICNHGTNRKLYDESEPSWGTVSAEILKPSRSALHYCYGWPCGEKPMYPDDQVYQNGSWGCFVPFTVKADSLNSTTTQKVIIECTTIRGAITKDGDVFKLKPSK